MSMSMMGSGIYAEEVDVEIVCKEYCSDCNNDQICEAVFTVNLMTDDWGNIDQSVKCEKCNHNIRYRQERD